MSRRIRKLRQMARAGLHREMSTGAFYIPVPGATPIECDVRVWRKKAFPSVGESDAGQFVVTEDRVRFFLPDLPSILRQGAVVSVAAGEAYRVEHYYPKDGDYQTARVAVLTDAEADGLPVRDDC